VAPELHDRLGRPIDPLGSAYGGRSQSSRTSERPGRERTAIVASEHARAADRALGALGAYPSFCVAPEAAEVEENAGLVADDLGIVTRLDGEDVSRTSSSVPSSIRMPMRPEST
jgi:hypothetical protein